ncbi:MAG: SDR family NAD(P)-dependent oxidoreductase, partial [Chloroflexi bacterium]
MSPESSTEGLLVGKTAIVTGGGRGIGRATALTLAANGADVVVAARTQREIEETAEAIEALGRRSLAIPADVSDPDDVDQLVETTLGVFERIDILVNNAGIIRPIDWVVETDVDDWLYNIE